MKILFNGLSYFTGKLVNELKEFSSQHKFVFCDTYVSKSAKIKFIGHLPSADLVVSFNGVSQKSGSLDAVIKLKKPLMMQWHGSDVLSIDINKSNGTFTPKYIDYASSYTDAAWLKSSLQEKNVDAKMLHFKHVDVQSGDASFSDFQVLTYLAQGHELTYGLNQILLLSNKFPEITFNIIGSNGENCHHNKNMIFHGWVNQNTKQKIESNCPIFIRLVKHDGYALSVMEALASGCYVIWNNPHPMCFQANSEHGLIDIFETALETARRNNLNRNVKAMDWVKSNFNRNKILSNYLKELEKLVTRK